MQRNSPTYSIFKAELKSARLSRDGSYGPFGFAIALALTYVRFLRDRRRAFVVALRVVWLIAHVTTTSRTHNSCHRFTLCPTQELKSALCPTQKLPTKLHNKTSLIAFDVVIDLLDRVLTIGWDEGTDTRSYR